MNRHGLRENEEIPVVPSRAGINSTVVIVSALVIVLFGISAVTYLIAAGREPDAVIGLLTAIAAPTLVSLFGMVRTEIVRKQTNGAMTAMHNRMARMEDSIPAAVNDPDAEMRDSSGE